MSDPLNPLSFVGSPEWRSALAALACMTPSLAALISGRLRRWQTWAAVAAGAILFPLSLAWVQAPIELALHWVWSRLFGASAAEGYLLSIAVPLVFVAGPVQEGVKLLAAIAALRGVRSTRRPLAGLVVGAAVGAGYGAMEAFWVISALSGPGWTWAVARTQGMPPAVVIVERLLAVAFHTGAAAVAGYGYAAGRPWRYLAVAVVLHGAMNCGDVLRAAGLVGIAAQEAWVALLSAATLGLALWLRHCTARRDPAGARPTVSTLV